MKQPHLAIHIYISGELAKPFIWANEASSYVLAASASDESTDALAETFDKIICNLP
jgi:hypothetical protein